MAYCSGDPLPLCALEKKPYPHGQDSDKKWIINFITRNILIHHLLRGFVADVRPHGKPTTKLNIANYNKYNKHTGGEGKNRTSLLRGFEPWRTFHCAAPTFTGWGARDSSCKTHKQQDFHLQACPFIPIYSYKFSFHLRNTGSRSASDHSRASVQSFHRNRFSCFIICRF